MRRFAVPITLAACATLVACADAPPGAAAATADDEAAVLATVERFFDAMGALDTAAYRAVVVPEAMTYSVRIGPDGPGPVRARSHAEHIAALAVSDRPWIERFWDARVFVHGPIALVWTPYDFSLGDEFSHCGIDAFELLRTDGVWRITNAQWTAEPDGCDPGPPARAAADGDERSAVLATVQRMFDAMAAGDADAYAATLVPDATSFAVRIDADGTQHVRMRTGAEEVAALRAATDRWEERAYDPVVFVHAPLAVYRAPFEFRVDGAFSHCGVNIFQLMQLDGEWRLTTATWTEETANCPERR